MGCSRRDVSRAKKAITEKGLTKDSAAGLSAGEVAELFPDGRRRAGSGFVAPDFASVVEAMKANRHYTRQQAWHRYISAPGEGLRYSYSQFCQLFNDYAEAHDVMATLHHEPGRVMLVDWAGDTIAVVEAVTGEVTKARLFVAVLPYSGMLFCAATADMKQAAWTAVHIGAFEFFGGVPQIVVPDNATSATYRPVRGEAARAVTPAYQQMADHYGTAIVPARVRKPRDKAAVESAVQVINKRVIGYLGHLESNTLDDLNEAITKRLEEINTTIRRKNGTTRAEVFAAEEAEQLCPLPVQRFEAVQWRQLKVGRNYHISCDHQYYSVPHQLAGQILRVRLTATMVTVFDAEQVVCEHQRLIGRRGQYSTMIEHAPKQHQDINGLWSSDW